MWVKVAQSCPNLCDPMDYTVHGILQSRILEWVAFLFSRGSSHPRDQTQASHIAGRFFNQLSHKGHPLKLYNCIILTNYLIYLSHLCFICRVSFVSTKFICRVSFLFWIYAYYFPYTFCQFLLKSHCINEVCLYYSVLLIVPSICTKT